MFVLSSVYQRMSVSRFSCVQNRVSNQFQLFDHELHRYDNLLSRTRPRLETITFKYNMKTDVLYQKHCLHKGNEYIFREDNSVNLFLLPFWKGVYFKRKEFAPWEQILFFYNRPLFRRDKAWWKPKRKTEELLPLHKMAEYLSGVFSYLKCNFRVL